jgi:hypothetical protein
MALLPTPRLLNTESNTEFNRIRMALHREIAPVGVIGQMYVDDFAYLGHYEAAPLESSNDQ